MNRNRLERLTISFLLLYVAGSAYVVAGLAAGLKVHFTWVAVSTVAFFVFAVLHALLSVGWRHTVVFVAISFGVSLLFELLGTSRGWIYGAYHYTGRLGPKILDLVPILVPLAWFMMMYASYTLANLLGRRGHGRESGGRLAWLIFLSAFAMTSWDLMNDPINVNGGHWVWHEQGAYFGIPLSNYVGWMLTTLVIFGLYRLYEAWRAPQFTPAVRPYFALLPVLSYGITMLSNIAVLIVTGQPTVAMIGFFSMGALLAAAVSRLTDT